MEEFIELMGVGMLVFLIFLGMASPVIVVGLIYFLKKRLDHKQVMAAIEKGTPLSDLKPLKRTGPLWIKNLTAGIALLIISTGLASVGFVYCEGRTPDENVWGLLIVALVFFAIGVSRFVRGLLQRKTEKAQSQIQPAN